MPLALLELLSMRPGRPMTRCDAWVGRQVATFIVQKILLDEMGLNYICATADRFFAVRLLVLRHCHAAIGHVCDRTNGVCVSWGSESR